MANLKQELELDEHKVDLDVLLKRYETDLDKGLTTAQAAEGLKKHGPLKNSQHQNTLREVTYIFSQIRAQRVITFTGGLPLNGRRIVSWKRG